MPDEIDRRSPVPWVYGAMAIAGVVVVVLTYVLFDGRPLTLSLGVLLLVLAGIGGFLRTIGRPN